MSTDDRGTRIKISREELYTPRVDEALARQRALQGAPPRVEEVSAVRKLLNNSLVYWPMAAAIGALLAFWIVEPRFDDMARVAGQVVLVNESPFDLPSGYIAVTVDDKVVAYHPGEVEQLPGPDGEPAFAAGYVPEVGNTVDVVGLAIENGSMAAMAIRPISPAEAAGIVDSDGQDGIWGFLYFVITAVMIALGLLIAEAMSSRNWSRAVPRILIGTLLTAIFAVFGELAGGMLYVAGEALAFRDIEGVVTIETMDTFPFLIHTAARSAAWACVGAGLGVGINLVRSTREQLRNSVLGGTLGGALGGLFFDPIDRFLPTSLFDGATTSRLVGVLAVGLMVGLFVALVERLAREAWLRVKTGPLAGKSFVLYKTPTVVGSAPSADVYLFKDAEIDGAHASIHRIGNAYEVEDMGTRHGTTVGGQPIRRRRLVSGDQIAVGATVLEFEERRPRVAPANPVGGK